MSNCKNCRHLRWTFGTVCMAFPAGIPHAILSSETGHDAPYPGDRGLSYEPLTQDDIVNGVQDQGFILTPPRPSDRP